MLKIALKLPHPRRYLIPQALHLDPLLQVVLKGFMLDKFKQTLARQLPMLALADQPRHLSHKDVLEDIPRLGYELVHLLEQFLPEVLQVPLCSLGQEKERAAIAGHELIERIHLDQLRGRIRVEAPAVRVRAERVGTAGARGGETEEADGLVMEGTGRQRKQVVLQGGGDVHCRLFGSNEDGVHPCPVAA